MLAKSKLGSSYFGAWADFHENQRSLNYCTRKLYHLRVLQCFWIWLIHRQFPHVVTVLWQGHRLIKTQIGHARDFAWYRGQRPSPARVILSHERVQIHTSENLCSYATNLSHFRARELLLCDILITRSGNGRWPRYQAKSLACPSVDRAETMWWPAVLSSTSSTS